MRDSTTTTIPDMMILDPRDCSGSTEWSSSSVEDSSSDSLRLSPSPDNGGSSGSSGSGSNSTSPGIKFEEESPLSPPRRMVRFDLQGSEEDGGPAALLAGLLGSSSHLDSSALESLTAPELRDKLDRAVQALQQTQIDLAAEKAQRRRKEKTIVKVAKELTKRISEAQHKSRIIKEVRAFLLWVSIGNPSFFSPIRFPLRRCGTPQLDASLRESERKLDAALVVAQSQIVDDRCAKLRDELRVSRQERDEATLALRSRAAEYREEKDFLRAQLLAVKAEGDQTRRAPPAGSLNVKLITTWLTVLFVVLAAVAWMTWRNGGICPV